MGKPRGRASPAIRDYFFNTVLAYLQPVRLHFGQPMELFLENNALYLVVCLEDGGTGIVNIPRTTFRASCGCPATTFFSSTTSSASTWLSCSRMWALKPLTASR